MSMRSGASLSSLGASQVFYAEDVLPLVCRHAPEPEWATYMTRRFGGMG